MIHVFPWVVAFMVDVMSPLSVIVIWPKTKTKLENMWELIVISVSY